MLLFSFGPESKIWNNFSKYFLEQPHYLDEFFYLQRQGFIMIIVVHQMKLKRKQLEIENLSEMKWKELLDATQWIGREKSALDWYWNKETRDWGNPKKSDDRESSRSPRYWRIFLHCFPCDRFILCGWIFFFGMC